MSAKQTQGMSWAEQMDKLFNNELPNNATLNVGNSGSLYAQFGMDDLRIGLERGVVTKALRKSKGSKSAHELSESDIRALKKEIMSPVAVINEDDRNSVLVVTDRVDKQGLPIVVAITKNTQVDYQDAHKITSVYGRVNLANDIARAGNENVIVYNNKRLQELTSVTPVTDRVDTESFEVDNSISQDNGVVKNRINYFAAKANAGEGQSTAERALENFVSPG